MSDLQKSMYFISFNFIHFRFTFHSFIHCKTKIIIEDNYHCQIIDNQQFI